MPFYVPTYYDGMRTVAPGFCTDQEEAIAASELEPDDRSRPIIRRGGLPRMRTFGF